jgi:hypothetical protein
MTDTLIAPVHLAEAASEALSASVLPGFVFQGGEIITFQAFRNGNNALVQITQIHTSYPGVTTVALSPSAPTASLDINVLIGSGWVQINEGTLDFTLNLSGSTPTGVTASALLNMYNSSGGERVCSVGGVYQLGF